MGERHGGVKLGKVHHAQDLSLWQRGKHQFNGLKARQGAFRTHQQMREVGQAIRGVGALALRIEDVDVVPPYPAQHLGPDRCDLLAHAAGNQKEFRNQLRHPATCKHHVAAVSKTPKPGGRAIGQYRINGSDVVHHVAVEERP